MIDGTKIKKRREALGLSQQELADRLYVTAQAVSQWENGKTQPDSDRILSLSNILGITAETLLSRDPGIAMRWQLADKMFSEEHMYARLKSTAQAEGLEETYRALPYMRRCHDGQLRKPARGAAEEVPYIIHPLTVACHAHALGVRDDEVLAVALLHDVCEDCGVAPEELPFSEPVRTAVKLLTRRKERTLEIGRNAALEEYYHGIRSSRTAMLVKCLDRCNNLSTMAASFSPEKMVQYIEETEAYVLPVLEDLKRRYMELNDAAFLLKYQILSLTETQKALLAGFEG